MDIKMKAMVLMLVMFLLTCIIPELAAASLLTETVARWNHKIDVWNRYYYISFFLVIAVAALGAISGMLQKAASDTAKTLAIICAYAVTVITVVVNAAALMDYKEIRKEINIAELKVSQLDMLIEKARLKENDMPYQMAIIEQARDIIQELHDIQFKVNIGAAFNNNFISQAYAGGIQSWVIQKKEGIPSSDDGQIICEGRDTDLQRAKDKARDSFIGQLDNKIMSMLEPIVRNSNIPQSRQAGVLNSVRNNHRELAEKIAMRIREQDVYFEEIMENGQNQYHYYLLYKVSPEYVNDVVQLQISIYQ